MRARVELLVTGILIGLLASGIILLLISEPRGRPVALLPRPSPQPVPVHVSGAVAHPGVVLVPPGSIVKDAIGAAGGALPGAALDRVNLASAVQPGDQVFVPGPPSPTVPAASGTIPAALPQAGTLAVNEASARELEALPGIGPVLAANIISYREAHGPFGRVEDLLRVPGIGPAKLEQIREYVRIP